MGADRRGPLAAFIVIAVIAGILLVTTVRSQAAPWFRATVVAGPATEPHLWDSVTAGVDQVVSDGAVLVRREAVAASASVVAPSVGQTSLPARHRRVAAHPRHPSGVPDQQPGTGPTTPTSTSGHDHGRHLGWSQGHGQSSGSGDAAGPVGNGHGHGHAYGHARMTHH